MSLLLRSDLRLATSCQAMEPSPQPAFSNSSLRKSCSHSFCSSRSPPVAHTTSSDLGYSMLISGVLSSSQDDVTHQHSNQRGGQLIGAMLR